MKYKVTYYDPMRWCDEGYAVSLFSTLEEAESELQKLAKQYPPMYHGAYIELEKTELVYRLNKACMEDV